MAAWREREDLQHAEFAERIKTLGNAKFI